MTTPRKQNQQANGEGNDNRAHSSINLPEATKECNRRSSTHNAPPDSTPTPVESDVFEIQDGAETPSLPTFHDPPNALRL
jgi:hypothetical protein